MAFPHQQTAPPPPPPLVTPARRAVEDAAVRGAASDAPAATPPMPLAKPLMPVVKPSSTPLMSRTRGNIAPVEPLVPPTKTTVTETTPSQAEPEDAVDVLARTGIVRSKQERPPVDIEQQLAAIMTTGSGIEAATGAASRAALLTGAHDPRATEAVLDAARRLLSLGKLQSASDVLLDFIGHGFTDREAQRLLIEVDCALGRRDVAKEKCTLLSQAYRLDGKADVADDVDRLAQML
jgi:hypothetical protein